MRHFPISVNYGIDISQDQLRRILFIDNQDDGPPTLCMRLSSIPGVTEVDYSDLTATVFLTVKSTFDHQLTWEAIMHNIWIVGGPDTCGDCKESLQDNLKELSGMMLCPSCYEGRRY